MNIYLKYHIVSIPCFKESYLFDQIGSTQKWKWNMIFCLMFEVCSSIDWKLKVPAKGIKRKEKNEAAGERGQSLCFKG